jgi:hypothetical protein
VTPPAVRFGSTQSAGPATIGAGRTTQTFTREDDPMVSLLKLYDEGGRAAVEAYHAEVRAKLTPEERAYNDGQVQGWIDAKLNYHQVIAINLGT